MNCGHSIDMLALFVEDDLHQVQAEIIRKQVDACENCQETFRQLQASQSLIKSRLKSSLRTPAATELFAAVRRNVLTRIEYGRAPLGWALRLERAVRLAFRKHGYALASVTALVIVSAALWGQVQHTSATQLAARFDGKDSLLRPDRYGDWISLGNGVYIDPAGYREYMRTGTFPGGTTIVMEHLRSEGADDPHGSLNASVKDSRFEGGWGFFEFSRELKASAVSDGSCRPCHEARGERDHVFTQSYPALKPARVPSVG